MPLSITPATNKLKTGKLKFCMASNPAFTDAEIESAIDDAVSEYSRRAPVKTVETISLVEGQSEYSWPAGAVKIEQLLLSDSESFHALYSGFPLTSSFVENLFSNFFTSRALVNRAQINLVTLQEALAGTLKSDKALRKFYVSPAPSESKNVRIPVWKAHVKASLTYNTVPDEHADIVIGFAAAILLRNIALAYSVNDEKVGDRDYRGGKTAGILISQAEELEECFYAAFMGGVILQG